MREALSYTAFALAAFAYVPYIASIAKGRVRPSKATWLIWVGIDILALGSMYAKYTLNGQIMAAALGATVVVVLSFVYGESGWTNLDKFCLMGAAIGLALWCFFDDPVLALVASMITNTIGALPMIVATWKDPKRENKLAWTVFWISCVCALGSIEEWSFASASQPVSFFTIGTATMVALYRRQLTL
jgi:hypothetical protein